MERKYPPNRLAFLLSSESCRNIAAPTHYSKLWCELILQRFEASIQLPAAELNILLQHVDIAHLHFEPYFALGQLFIETICYYQYIS